MHDVLTKLWASKGTIAILVWVAVFAWVFNISWSKKPIIKQEISHKTLEEIIATPVDHTESPAWDKDFKSSIEALE